MKIAHPAFQSPLSAAAFHDEGCGDEIIAEFLTNFEALRKRDLARSLAEKIRDENLRAKLTKKFKSSHAAMKTRTVGLYLIALITYWTRCDHAAFAEWINSLPEGTTRTTAVKAFIKQVATIDPQAARQWAQTLPPGTERDSAIRLLGNGKP